MMPLYPQNKLNFHGRKKRKFLSVKENTKPELLFLFNYFRSHDQAKQRANCNVRKARAKPGGSIPPKKYCGIVAVTSMMIK